MKKETYIAAIEIGSSKITGAVGKYLPEENKLNVLAICQEPSKEAVRYGIIQNPEEVAAKVDRIIENLNNNPAVTPRKIKSVYVGLSGRSLRSISTEVDLSYPEEVEITGTILSNLRNDATSIALESNTEILALVPRDYKVDGMETTSPKGSMGKSIKAVFDVIVGRSELKRNIQRAFDRTGVEVKGLVITPLATADVVLSDEEKRLGCMLVDFGAETTSVSIYRRGSLFYYVTLPLGGRNITIDLTTLKLLEERAEEIKCESGRAVAPENPSTLILSGIKLSDVNNLVVARAEEIVANVVQQITYAGLKDKDLGAGIICIGGGSKLNGMLELLENQTGLNAKSGSLIRDIHTMESKAKRLDTIQTSAILYEGARLSEEDCLEAPIPEMEDVDNDPDGFPDFENEPKPVREGAGKRFLRNLSTKLGNMFAAPSDEESELD